MTEEKMFTYQARLHVDHQIEALLDSYGKLFGIVERALFRDLQKSISLNTLKSSYILKYQITARHFNACRISLQGKIASIQERRKIQIQELSEKIASLEKKLPKIKKAEVVHQKKRSLHKMHQKKAHLMQETQEGKVSLCFGSKKLFRAQFDLEKNDYNSHEEWKEEWEKARSSEFLNLGSKDEAAGNQSCVITAQDHFHFSLRLRLPDALSLQFGSKYLLINHVFFAYGNQEIQKALLANRAMTYRFKKDAKGWIVFVSFKQASTPIVTNKVLGAVGIDLNEDHVALVEIDRHGNPIGKERLPLCTYGKSKDEAKSIIYEVCKKIVLFAKEKKKPIIAEELDFQKKRTLLKELPKRFARKLSSFAYSHFLESLSRKAFKEGVELFAVNPAFTSVIGRVKFAARYGLSTHLAAALCIARRFYHFSESPPKRTLKWVHKNLQVTSPVPVRKHGEHVWKVWARVKKKIAAVHAELAQKSSGPRYCRS